MSHLVKSVDVFTHQGFSKIKQPNHYNEDRVYAGTNTFAVIDGATSMVDAQMGELNPSAYTSNFLFKFMAKNDDADLSALELLEKANAEFREGLKQNWPEIMELGKLGPSAAVALFKIHDQNKATISNIADCSIVIEQDNEWSVVSYHYDRHSELDKNLADLIFEKVDQGLSVSEARKTSEIAKMRKDNRLLLNKEYGFFTAEPEAVDFMKGKEINLDNVKTVVLFSDGLVWPSKEDSEKVLIETASSMKELGISSYYERLKTERDLDSDFKKFRRGKHMDDATGIVIRLKD